MTVDGDTSNPLLPGDSIRGQLAVSDGMIVVESIGDDPSWLIARGHHRPEAFLIACGGWLDGDHSLDSTMAEEVEHRWCYVGPGPDFREPDFLEWYHFGDDITAATPGAFPITVLVL